MISAEKKQAIIKQYATKEGDTGSPEVQIAILTEAINVLNDHLKYHIHDFASKRGQMMKIGQRRSLLKYLQEKDINRYRALIDKLGLRR